MLKHLTAAALLLSAITLAVPADAVTYGSSSSSSSGSSRAVSTKPAMATPWHRAKTAKGTIWVDSRGFADNDLHSPVKRRRRSLNSSSVRRLALGSLRRR